MDQKLNEVLAGPAPLIAPRLLGCHLLRETSSGIMLAQIVETEAYDQTDEASHSYGGISSKNAVMYGPAGHLYVYLSYGIHYCCNVVCGQTGQGTGVLIRAAKPLSGLDQMRHLRPVNDLNLLSGPGKLCQALAIDMRLSGHDLSSSPLKLLIMPPVDSSDIVTTTRVGISKAKHQPWRFYLKDLKYISRPL